MSPPWHLYGPFFIIIVCIIIAISIFCFVGIICCLCNAHRDLQTNRRQQQPSVRMRRIRSNSSDKKLQQFDEIGRMGLGHGQVGERCHIVSEGRRSGKVVSGRNKAGSTPKRRITKPHIVAGRLYGQSYEMLRYKAAEAGKLFCDDQFPPDKFSISYNGKVGGKDVDEVVKEWIRASGLYPDPRMIIDGATISDVNQGALGDCWFLAAIADLAANPVLFGKVVPSGQSFRDGYQGIFRFSFYRFGEWVEVVVDDFIPVNSKLRPIFLHSKDNGEMWPVLLEKAYAKLHGSYSHLSGGLSTSALVDLTGGFPEQIFGNATLNSADVDVFAKLQKIFSRSSTSPSKTLVCAGTRGGRWRYNGLVGSHAYSVLGVMENKAKEIPKLVKIRNPWGNATGEWNGDWSKSWIQTNRPNLAHLLEASIMRSDGKSDGEFYLPYDVFLQYFGSLYLCHILGSEFTQKHICDTWTSGKTKLMFMVHLDSETETFFSLSQMCRRQLRDEMDSEDTMLDIKLEILNHQQNDIVQQSFCKIRTRTYHSDCLSKGAYLVCCMVKNVDEDTQLLLRVASKCRNLKMWNY